MGIIMTFYVIALFCFSHRVSGVFAHSFVIYIFRFFTEFFKDSIHSIRCSSG
jgi:hypothetical protein